MTTNNNSKIFDPKMLEALICPLTHGTLSLDAPNNELISKSAHVAYPIRNGIPILLEDEARNLDDPRSD